MKKISIFICTIIMMLVFACLEYYFRSFEIADGVKIKRMINGDYYVVYQGAKIGGVITAVDSWYIYQHYVHGSTTIENTGDDIIYFLIDVCSKEVYQTEDSSKFYSYLEEKNIPEDQMGNYMSGDNVIDMRTHQNKYSYEYHCPGKEYQVLRDEAYTGKVLPDGKKEKVLEDKINPDNNQKNGNHAEKKIMSHITQQNQNGANIDSIQLNIQNTSDEFKGACYGCGGQDGMGGTIEDFKNLNKDLKIRIEHGSTGTRP